MGSQGCIAIFKMVASISVVSDFKEYLQTVRLPFGISNTEGIYFVLNLLTYNRKDENYTGF